MKALIPKQISKRFLKGLGFRTFRIFVLVVGLTILFLYYGTVVHAEAVYSFTKSMGGTNGDFGQSVITDSYGNVYITGYFSGTADFDPGIITDNHTSAGLEDIFLTKINSDGSYGFTKIMGGTDQDFGQSVAVDGSDNVYITGYFSGTADFDPGASKDNHTSAGLEDIFITKINFDGSYDLTATIGGTDNEVGQSLTLDDNVHLYLTGYFSGTDVDFNPGTGTDYHASAGLEDIFLTKFRLVGFVITPASVTTNGAGDEASFTVRLLSEPSENVILPVSSSNLTIGTVDKSNLTFTYRNWSVDQTITVTSLVSSSQTYSIILAETISGDADYNGLNPTDVTVKNVGSDSEGNGCFIATSAYGSSMEPHVKILRDFRDRFLIGNTVGKIFVHLYYTYSPPIADFIAKHDSLKAIVRIALLPIVALSWIALKIGPVLAVALMLFLVSCFIGTVWFRRRYNE